MKDIMANVGEGLAAALIAGAGVASSAFIAYSLSKRDDQAIDNLRKDLQDARDLGREISTQAKLSIEAARNDLKSSSAEHAETEERITSNLNSVRDEAYAAIKSAERALALAQTDSTRTTQMASDLAAHSSSIRVDLDRLSQEMRLTNIATARLISTSAENAEAQAAIANAMEQTQVAGDSATGSWQDYHDQYVSSGAKISSKKMSYTRSLDEVFVLCKNDCLANAAGCTAVSVSVPQNRLKEKTCNLYKGSVTLLKGGKKGREKAAIWSDSYAKDGDTDSSAPKLLQWTDYNDQYINSGQHLGQKAMSYKTSLKDALTGCKNDCVNATNGAPPGCNAVSVSRPKNQLKQKTCHWFKQPVTLQPGGKKGREKAAILA